MNPQHISSPDDLVTTHEATRQGFLEQAFAKTEKAEAYLEDAILLKEALDEVPHVGSLIEMHPIRDHLMAAAGFSTKAQSHLSDAELDESLGRVLTSIAEKASDGWRDEILYRYLLTKGDSLGGSMRNLTGAMAGEQLIKAILVPLHQQGAEPALSRSDTGKIQSISWDDRVLLFDKKPRFINKSVDVILLHASGSAGPPINSPDSFLACGELKGGIDPAGADEHWKTAKSALDRIRTAFEDTPPSLFFVAAAIQATMAVEIFEQLETGALGHAANLTSPTQLSDLASWLVSL